MEKNKVKNHIFFCHSQLMNHFPFSENLELKIFDFKAMVMLARLLFPYIWRIKIVIVV